MKVLEIPDRYSDFCTTEAVRTLNTFLSRVGDPTPESRLVKALGWQSHQVLAIFLRLECRGFAKITVRAYDVTGQHVATGRWKDGPPVSLPGYTYSVHYQVLEPVRFILV